jgi:hypothetical protein
MLEDFEAKVYERQEKAGTEQGVAKNNRRKRRRTLAVLPMVESQAAGN